MRTAGEQNVGNVHTDFAKNFAKKRFFEVEISIFRKTPEKIEISRLDFFKFLQWKHAIFDAKSIDTIINNRVDRFATLKIAYMHQTSFVFEKIKVDFFDVF